MIMDLKVMLLSLLMGAISLVIWIELVRRWPRSDTGGTAEQRRGELTLWVFLLGLALLSVATIPAVQLRINAMSGGGLGVLIVVVGACFAAVALAETLREIQFPESAARGRTTRLFAVAALVIALLILYSAADIQSNHRWPLFVHPLPPAMVAFWLLFLAEFTSAMAYAAFMGARYARAAHGSTVRTSLLFVSAAGTSGLVIAAATAFGFVFGAESFVGGVGGQLVAPATAALMALFMGTVTWHRVAAWAPVARLRDRRAIRGLLPLWRDLRPIDPDMDLAAAIRMSDPADPRRSGDVEPALHLTRITVEIHDWLLQLSAYLPANALAKVQDLCGTRGLAEWDANVLAASAWINAGFAQREAGEVVAAGGPVPGSAGELDMEVSFLRAVNKRRRKKQSKSIAAELLSGTVHRADDLHPN